MFRAVQEEDKFVRGIKVVPEPAIILAQDKQLQDLVRFCTVAGEDFILTVDPTFSLGDFDLTPVTYRHRLLVSRRTGRPPVCLGPVMIHFRKTFSTYHFFASSLVELAPDLENLSYK